MAKCIEIIHLVHSNGKNRQTTQVKNINIKTNIKICYLALHILLFFQKNFHAILKVSTKDRLGSPPNMQGPKVGTI